MQQFGNRQSGHQTTTGPLFITRTIFMLGNVEWQKNCENFEMPQRFFPRIFFRNCIIKNKVRNCHIFNISLNQKINLNVEYTYNLPSTYFGPSPGH
jgi:hypothetical protein